MGFTCEVCGRRHDGVRRDVRARWPEPVFRLSEEERSEKTDFGEDLGWFQDDGVVHHYVRGVVAIPIVGADEDFRFGAWIEVSRESWAELAERWGERGDGRSGYEGVLANELAPYSGTEGLSVRLRPNPNERLLPLVELRDTRHPLGRDQAAGVSTVRAHELAGF